MIKEFAGLAALGLLLCCAPAGRIDTGDLAAEDVTAISRADSLFRKGSFTALKQAGDLYERLYGRPKLRRTLAPKLFMTSVLLSVREKELGILNTSHLDRALALLAEDRKLAGYSVYSDIAAVYWVQGKGVMRDIDTRFAWNDIAARLKRAEPDLADAAAGDEFKAYMHAAYRCAFNPEQGASRVEQKGDPARVRELFPGSPLLAFKRATCPRDNPELLKELLAADPEFYEADYFLGNEALSRGNLLEAEEFYLKSLSGIPGSPQTTISLAAIAFAVEEFERSLAHYEKTLALAPGYRDALLGKAMCLSYLDRPGEAIPVCRELIGLGYWLLGEGYYWLARCQHELKDGAAAAASIEEAKGRLPTSTEVFALSGSIALEAGDTVKAEKDLKEALQYNRSNAEALMLLGGVQSRKKDWTSAAACYEKAAFVYEDQQAGLETKISDIWNSRMADGRKSALLKRKAAQVEKVNLAMAAAFYDAGAAYINFGQKQKAAEMAERSAGHPAFRQRAEDLISRTR